MKKALLFIVALSLLLNISSRLQGQDDPPAPVLTVHLDIKPEGCPNPLNVRSRGVLPAAVLGTSDFDVSQIDPTSLLLEGVSPLRWNEEDVATPFPFSGALTVGEEEVAGPNPFTGDLVECTDCTDEGPDGFVDLTLKFDNQAVVAAMASDTDGEVQVLTLTGQLKDGTAISGADVVCVKKKKTDFDDDGETGFGDFLAFARQFGLKKGHAKYDDRFDLDDDGEVGFGDFIEFGVTFGSSKGKSGAKGKSEDKGKSEGKGKSGDKGKSEGKGKPVG